MHRLLSLCVCLSLGLGWGPQATAAGPEPTRDETRSEDVPPEILAQAKDLYERGKARYETLDYAGAVDLWTQAYDLLDDEPATRAIRNNLVYNIATAQQKAYELDGDVVHLRKAKGLLEKYVAEFKSLYRGTPEGRAEVAEIEQRIAVIEEQLARVDERAQPRAQPSVETTAPRAEPATQRPPRVKDVLREDPLLWSRYRRARGMLVGGGVSLGVGTLVSLLSLMALQPGLPRGVGSGKRVTPGAVVGFAIGGSGIIAGAILLGFGASRRRAVLEDARKKLVVAPSFGRDGFGISATFRF